MKFRQLSEFFHGFPLFRTQFPITISSRASVTESTNRHRLARRAAQTSTTTASIQTSGGMDQDILNQARKEDGVVVASHLDQTSRFGNTYSMHITSSSPTYQSDSILTGEVGASDHSLRDIVQPPEGTPDEWTHQSGTRSASTRYAASSFTSMAGESFSWSDAGGADKGERYDLAWHNGSLDASPLYLYTITATGHGGGNAPGFSPGDPPQDFQTFLGNFFLPLNPSLVTSGNGIAGLTNALPANPSQQQVAQRSWVDGDNHLHVYTEWASGNWEHATYDGPEGGGG